MGAECPSQAALFRGVTLESSGTCGNGIRLIPTAEKLLVGHCKGNTPTDASKSHIVAMNWITAGDTDFLSSLRPLIPNCFLQQL